MCLPTCLQSAYTIVIIYIYDLVHRAPTYIIPFRCQVQRFPENRKILRWKTVCALQFVKFSTKLSLIFYYYYMHAYNRSRFYYRTTANTMLNYDLLYRWPQICKLNTVAQIWNQFLQPFRKCVWYKKNIISFRLQNRFWNASI